MMDNVQRAEFAEAFRNRTKKFVVDNLKFTELCQN